jgi:hypothetical protein
MNDLIAALGSACQASGVPDNWNITVPLDPGYGRFTMMVGT